MVNAQPPVASVVCVFPKPCEDTFTPATGAPVPASTTRNRMDEWVLSAEAAAPFVVSGRVCATRLNSPAKSHIPARTAAQFDLLSFNSIFIRNPSRLKYAPDRK